MEQIPAPLFEKVRSIVGRFDICGDVTGAHEVIVGHINPTYWINTTESAYVLQKINTSIFHDPVGLMQNIVAVTEHIGKKIRSAGGDPARQVLQVIPTKDGDVLARIDGDAEPEYWRLYLAITGAESHDQVTSNEMFCKVGRAFGHFQRQLADFDASVLTETIPAFHDTVRRYEAFDQAVAADAAGRRASVGEEIRFLTERRCHAGFIVDGIREGRLPLRVTHNDTKLNNVMIDNQTGEGICVIDLDTVMPGSVLADFGDAIRFGASSAAEDETDLSKVYVRLDAFEAFTKGFVESLDHSLSEEEIRALPMGAYMMTLEVGLRFLTDYLNGDTYFRTAYPQHNLDRARNQFKLVADMEAKMSQMREIVEKYI